MALRVPGARLVVIPVDGPKITIDASDGGGLRMTWDITRTADDQLESGQIEIYNLGERTRGLLEGAIQPKRAEASSQAPPWKTGLELPADAPTTASSYGYAYARFEAGFDGVLEQLWEGTTSRIRSRHEGVDWITTIPVGDGELLAHAKANRTFDSGTPIFRVVQHLAALMGVGRGNVSEAGFAALVPGQPYLGDSYTSHGDPADQLTQMLRPFGLSWFIDDGALWLVGPSGALNAPPVDLGVPRVYPEVSEDGWLVEVNLNGRARPGLRALIQSAAVRGDTKIQAAQHTGDTRAGDPLTIVQLDALGVIGGGA